MQDRALGRVRLIVTHDGLQGLAIQRDVQNAGEKGLFGHVPVQGIGVEGDTDGGFAATVHNAGDLAFTTQAAARTFPCITPGFRGDSELMCH